MSRQSQEGHDRCTHRIRRGDTRMVHRDQIRRDTLVSQLNS
jgi:hypothetical protein